MTFVAVVSATIIGQLGLVFAPFLLPLATQQTGAGDTLVSGILAAEFVAYLVSGLIGSSVRVFAPDRVASIACVCYALGSLGAALTHEPLLFLCARMVCGASGGAVMVSANRAVASHDAFNRLFAGAIIGTAVFATVGLVAVPSIFQHAGSSATYATLGAFGLAAAACSPWLRPGGRVVALSSASWGAAAWLMLFAYFLSRLSDAALWPYIERFGERVGFDASTVGIVLAAATLVSIAGPLLALRVKRSRGVFLMFAAVLIGKGSAPLFMALFPTHIAFVAVQVVVSFTLVLASQLFLSHFSSIDASGRLAGLSGTAGLTADAVGVTIASQAFAVDAFRGVAASSAVIGLLALVVGLSVLIASGRGGRSGAALA